MTRGARFAVLFGLVLAGGVATYQLAKVSAPKRAAASLVKRSMDRRNRLTLASGGGQGIAREYPFTSNGPLLVDDSNTRCHFYIDSSGNPQDTKGCVWTTNGTPALDTTTAFYPDGFAATSRQARGPLDDTNNYQLGTGSDVLDITTGTICAIFAITAASTGAQQNIYTNHDGTRGWRLFVISTNGSRQICAHWAPSGQTPCGANAPLDTPFLACFGHDGTSGYNAIGGGGWNIATTGNVPQAPTAAPAYLGRANSAGTPGNVKILELWVTTTTPANIDMPTLWARTFGHLSTDGETLALSRSTAGTWSVNGTTYNGTVGAMRMNEYGAYLDTDWVRFDYGLGVGSASGGMAFTYAPNYANNVATDKILVSDNPWGGDALGTPRVELRYVAATDTFKLTVGATTVSSAAQTFSANTSIGLTWSYAAGVSACLGINGIETCGALTSVVPNPFISLGGNLHNTYALGAFRNVQFYESTGTYAQVIAALGDSTTEGHFGDSARITYPERLMAALGTGFIVDNHGIVGDIMAGLQARYKGGIKGRGYSTVVLIGGINNIMTLSHTGAATFTTWQAVADEILADGLELVASTAFPFEGSGGWSAGKQTELDAFNAAILAWCATNAANPKLGCFDGYTALEDPGNADALLPAYEYTDHLHLSAAGNTAVATLVQAALP